METDKHDKQSYLLRGVPRVLLRAVHAKAVAEGATIRGVLLDALEGYARGVPAQPPVVSLAPLGPRRFRPQPK